MRLVGGPCHYNAPNETFYGGECQHYRLAVANNDTSLYWNFVGSGRRYDKPNKPNALLQSASNTLTPVFVTKASSTATACLQDARQGAIAGGVAAIGSAGLASPAIAGGAIGGCAVNVGSEFVGSLSSSAGRLYGGGAYVIDALKIWNAFR